MPSIYDLKPRFQALLRPLVVRLACRRRDRQSGHAAGLRWCRVAIGAAICLAPERRSLFVLIPLWMLLRMALNAIDGMLAREFGQKSPLGAYLNELTDVFSDAALYLPFACPAALSAAVGVRGDRSGDGKRIRRRARPDGRRLAPL